jgi:hypothetical protein
MFTNIKINRRGRRCVGGVFSVGRDFFGGDCFLCFIPFTIGKKKERKISVGRRLEALPRLAVAGLSRFGGRGAWLVAGTRVGKRAVAPGGTGGLPRGCGPIDPVRDTAWGRVRFSAGGGSTTATPTLVRGAISAARRGQSHFRLDESWDSPRAKNGTVPMLPTAKRQMLRALRVTGDGRAVEGLLAFWRCSGARLSPVGFLSFPWTVIRHKRSGCMYILLDTRVQGLFLGHGGVAAGDQETGREGGGWGVDGSRRGAEALANLSHHMGKLTNSVPLLGTSSAGRKPLPWHCLFQRVAGN